MAKYKVGDELIIVNDPTQEAEKLKMTVCEAFKDSKISHDYLMLAKKIIENE